MTNANTLADRVEGAVKRMVRWQRPRWASLAMSYDDALRVARRKTAWMAQYLRARRTGDSLIGFYRRNHFAALRARNGSNTDG